MRFKCYHAIRFSGNKSVVDRDSGVIKGAAIMSIGAAKGHGVLIDNTTLEQVMVAAQKYESGMPVKFNPSTFDHGPGSYVGMVPNDTLSIDKEAGVLRGDIHVLPSYQGKDYVYDLAENQPDTFGNSLEFDGTPEDINGALFSRCSELYGMMLVDQPAANSTGFFSSKGETPVTKKTDMTEEDMKQYKSMLSEAVSPMAATVAELKQGYADLDAKFSKFADKSKCDDDPDTEDMSEDAIASEQLAAGVTGADSQLQANRKINTYRANKGKPVTIGDIESIVNRSVMGLMRTSGGRSVTPSHKGGEKAENRFMARVDKLVEGGMSKPAAMATAVRTSKQNGDDYKEYCQAKGLTPNRMTVAGGAK